MTNQIAFGPLTRSMFSRSKEILLNGEKIGKLEIGAGYASVRFDNNDDGKYPFRNEEDAVAFVSRRFA
jgi:hypothetical protein